MKKLREFGDNMGEYFAFPTLEQLQKITKEQFRQMGAGYRDDYLVKAIKQLCGVDFEEKKKLSTPELRKWLLSICGVGPKVADCILLFSMKKHEAFPVDTWIKRVMAELYNESKDIKKIASFAEEKFGKNAGIAQQYLFYYMRENY